MGFGYGRTTYHGNAEARDNESGARVQSVFSNDMVAHVWNAQRQSFGRSNNGNFYFEGRTLYSYGGHFPVAFIAPDGVAILNADSYSISTSRHQSTAAGACRDRTRVWIPNLDKAPLGLVEAFADSPEHFRGDKREARAAIRNGWRHYIRDNAEALAAAPVCPAGEWRRHESADDIGRESAGAYLTRLAGLPAASWPKLQREAERNAKRKAEREAREAAKREAAEIKRAADMSDSQFRAVLGRLIDSYNPEHGLAELAKRLRRLKIAAKREGYSKRRLDSIRAREKAARAAIETATEERARREARKARRSDIAAIRAAAVAFRDYEIRPSGIATHNGTALGHIGERAAAAMDRLATRCYALPIASRERLAAMAERAADASGRLRSEYLAKLEEDRRQQAEAREREAAERRAAWLRGEDVRAGHFDSEHGGAALRVVGDELQTSHGATVPLAHAVKVFRFVKLCRERGQAWQRNGRTIRVGHFQVDAIEPSGNFRAGCHFIAWPEVERAAKQAGVFDCPADDSAVESRAAA